MAVEAEGQKVEQETPVLTGTLPAPAASPKESRTGDSGPGAPLSPETPAETYSSLLEETGNRTQLLNRLQSGYGNRYTGQVIEGVRAPRRGEPIIREKEEKEKGTGKEKEEDAGEKEEKEEKEKGTGKEKEEGAGEKEEKRTEKAEKTEKKEKGTGKESGKESGAEKSEEGEPAAAEEEKAAGKEKKEKGTGEKEEKEKKKKEKKGPAGNGAKKEAPGAAEEAAEEPSGAAAFFLEAGANAFKKVKRKIRRLGKHEKTHKTAKDKREESEKAVVRPELEPQSRANQGKVETVNKRTEPAANDKEARGTLDEEVKKATPKKISQVDSFKRDGKAQNIRKMVMVNVRGQTETVKQTYRDIGEVPEQPKPPGSPPIPEPEAAPPTGALQMGKELLPTLPEEMTDLSNYEKEVEDQVAAEGLDPQELALVDSGPLAEANALRGQIKEKVQAAPGRIRQTETEEKDGMEQTLDGDEKSARVHMNVKRKKELGKVKEAQDSKKLSEEEKRKKVTDEIQRIYKSAKETVTTKLDNLETQSLKQFDEGQKAAADTFEETVKEDMRAYKKSRYGGYFGWTKKAKDWALGMDKLSRVKEIFTDAKDTFVAAINSLITTIIDNTKQVITDCKNTIQKARDDIAALVEPLEPGLKKAAEAAQKEFTQRLDALDRKVNAKEKELKEKLDERRKLAIKKIDEKIKKMKEELKGIGHKAKKLLLKGALKLLKWALEKAGAPVGQIMDFLRKAASAFWSIIKSPGTFLSNLINALFGGFKQFRKNIVTHLKKGLMDWLFGTMSAEGITIPEDFSAKSIFGLVMQVLAITPAVIKQKIAVYVGQENVERVEKIWEHISTFIRYGPQGLWEQIKEYISDLRERAIGGIRDWVRNRVIFGAIEWILSLFSPVSGIVKVGKMIYKVAKFVMQRIRQIIDLLTAIVNSLSDIASGAIGSAVDWIEKTLARMVPVAIGFLAALLDMSGISGVIRGFIEKVRKPIHNALDKVIARIAAKIGGLLGKGKEEKPGKEGEEKKKTGKDGEPLEEQLTLIRSFKEPFTMEGKSHHLYTKYKNGTIEVEMASEFRERLIDKIDYALKVELADKEGGKWRDLKKSIADRRKNLVELGSTINLWKHERNMRRLESCFEEIKKIAGKLKRLGDKHEIESFKNLGHQSKYVSIDNKLNYKHPIFKGKTGGDAIRPVLYKGWKSTATSWRDNKLKTNYGIGNGVQDPASTGHFISELSSMEPTKFPRKKISGKTVASIPKIEVAIDHKTSVGKHWNKDGNNMHQNPRETWYNDTGNLRLISGPLNSSLSGDKYEPDVKENFLGPDEP